MLLYSYVYNNLFYINNTACAKIQLNARGVSIILLMR